MTLRWKLKNKKFLFVLGGLALIGVMAAAVWFPSYPIRISDKEEAAQRLVAWIVENRILPGFFEEYPDAKWMPGMNRFFVVCDFLPPGAVISSDPRVRRITEAEFDEVFKKYRYEKTDYLFILLKEDEGTTCSFEVTNSFGSLAGHFYRFVLSRKLWGIDFKGKLERVS